MVYRETTYKLTVKNSYKNGLDADKIQLLINSTFNNLTVKVVKEE